jgi:hypothetical protein
VIQAVLVGILLALAAPGAPDAGAQGNQFKSPVGLSLEKPDGWSFVSREGVLQQAAGAKLADPEMEKKLKEREKDYTGQIVYVVGDGHGIRPSFQVHLALIPPANSKVTSEQILRSALPSLLKAFPDCRVESDVKAMQVAGMPAAEVVLAHSMAMPDGASVPARSRFIVVARGKVYFTIGMLASQTDVDRVRPDFEKMLASLRISTEP